MSTPHTSHPNTLRIRVSPKDDGFVFAIDPRDRALLTRSGAAPADKIFIAYGARQDFAIYHEREGMLSQIVHLLTGLTHASLASFISQVVFIQATDNTVLDTVVLAP